MEVLIFGCGILGALVVTQNAGLLVLREPVRLALDPGAGSEKRVRLVLRVIVQATVLVWLGLYPFLIGRSPIAFYGAMFPLRDAHWLWKGWLYGLVVLGAVFLAESRFRCFEYGLECPRPRIPGKMVRRLASAFGVVAVEEPLFRGIAVGGLTGTLGPAGAVLLGAGMFSAAHYVRRHKEHGAALGLFVLGVQLGVAYGVTHSLWLSMGLHGGGLLAITLHRLFVAKYRGPAWLIGTRDFPIAGLITIGVMLATAWGIWRFVH